MLKYLLAAAGVAVFFFAKLANAADLPVKMPTASAPTLGLNCTASLGMTDGYLLGQAGAKVSKSLMIDPALDCTHTSGFGFAAEGYFATDQGPFRYELDGLVRYVKTFDRLTVGARAGAYYVSPGGAPVTILTARAWADYTIPLMDRLTLVVGGALDELHHSGLHKNTVGWATNLTLSWAATERLTLSLGGQRWDWLSVGFFENGRPNHKIVPGFAYAINNTWTLSGQWVVHKGNQFDHTVRRWEHSAGLTLAVKLPPL